MAIKIKPNQMCQYASCCPYNKITTTQSSICKGADNNRSYDFICDLIGSDGIFVENKFRSQFDETGRMKILNEQENTKNV